mmetsp:Transcript_93825/g.254661  ORF Transcript_93825/g.254661 Transcript_93825/m.254661 type:complete len:272 (+) Transcript_93825:38-853(+)
MLLTCRRMEGTEGPHRPSDGDPQEREAIHTERVEKSGSARAAAQWPQARSWNLVEGSAAKAAGGPNSAAAPRSMTRTLSEPMMVFMRWAIVIVVNWFVVTSFRSTSWIRASVRKSTLAVASSSTRMRQPRRNARAAQTSCRWPTERLSPPDVRWCRRPSSEAKSVSCTFLSCSMISSSLRSPKGSMLKRSVPVKPTGSCGMIASRRRRVCSPMSEMSAPSIVILPASRGHMRNRACSSELFPAPVRPTTPTLVPPGTVKDMLFSTVGRSSR